MRSRAARLPASPPPATLRCNDLRFVNEYLRNGGNGTQAYLSIHPTAKYTSAAVSADRTLKKASVRAELARRTQYEGGITKDFVSTRLLEYEDMAYAKQDYIAGASIAMDCAKLAGFLVEKREVTTLSEEKKTALRSLLDRTLPAPKLVDNGDFMRQNSTSSSEATLSQ